jgi:hypothetical protein
MITNITFYIFCLGLSGETVRKMGSAVVGPDGPSSCKDGLVLRGTMDPPYLRRRLWLSCV